MSKKSKEEQRLYDQRRYQAMKNGTWKKSFTIGVRQRGRSCYNNGCAHKECAQANRDYQRERARRLKGKDSFREELRNAEEAGH